MRGLVLCSGGPDSLVCCERLHRRHQLAGGVFVDYRQPARSPESYAAFHWFGERGMMDRLRVLHALDLDLGEMKAETGARVVPARNAVLLSLAANLAPSMGADTLVIGCNAADQRDYVDCRPGFLRLMGEALGIAVIAPLGLTPKVEIMEEARGYGLHYWSCYRGDQAPCGCCPSCEEAAR